MKKNLIFALLISQPVFCMGMVQENGDVVINFEEDDGKEVDADSLVARQETNLESGVNFQDFYNQKEKRIEGLMIHLSNKLGIKRTQVTGKQPKNKSDFYLCLIAANLEKLSGHIADNSEKSQDVEKENLRILKRQVCENRIVSALSLAISVASVIVFAITGAGN